MNPNEQQIEIAKLILTQKLEFIRTVYETGMTWWISSVVFNVSFIAAVWSKRSELQTLPQFLSIFLSILVFLFLSSVVFYGFYIAIRLRIIKDDVNKLLLLVDSNESMSELDTLFFSYIIGTTSFIFLLVTWPICVFFLFFT